MKQDSWEPCVSYRLVAICQDIHGIIEQKRIGHHHKFTRSLAYRRHADRDLRDVAEILWDLLSTARRGNFSLWRYLMD